MKAPKPLFGIFAIATGLLTLCGATAKADSLIYESESGGLSWNIGGESGTNGSFSVPQFNPALGTLDSVEISAECAYSSAVTVSGPDGASGTVHAEGSVNIQDPENYIYFSGRTLYGAWNANYSLPSFPNCNGADVGDTQGSVTYNSPAVLSEFTGDGNFSFQVTGSQSVFLNGPGTANIDSATLTASADVTYVYTVPEPGTFSLLAVGFGLTLTRRTTQKLLNR